MRVGDLMNRSVEVVRLDADVHELEKLLLERRVHGVPVVDDAGVLVGVVSQTDLLAWHFNAGIDGASYYDGPEESEPKRPGLRLSDIRQATVEEIMSPVVHCIRADRPIAVAASTMIERRIHRLIVVDDQLHVTGLLSVLDTLHALAGVEDLLTPERRVGAN